MRMLRFFATKAGVALTVVMLLAGASVAYAMVRSTTELPGSFVAVEATYGLSILDAEGQPLTALEFGEVVQGDRATQRFGVRNDGNTRAKLGFRVRAGDGKNNVFEPTEHCAVPGPQDQPRPLPAVGEDVGLKLREWHRSFHEDMGELDTPEKEEKHQQFHKELEEKNREFTAQGNVSPDGVRPSHQLTGLRIDVPGLTSFCFVAGPQRDAIVLPPGGMIGVGVIIQTDPDVVLGLQEFTILVDAHDLAE